VSGQLDGNAGVAGDSCSIIFFQVDVVA